MSNFVQPKKGIIDVTRYGFAIYCVADGGSKFYRRQFQGFFIELMVTDDIYNLSSWRDDEKELTVANRYKVSTQEEMDFLILNGRVGYLFT